MAVAAVHGDVVLAVGHVERHALIPLQPIAYLIKVANGEVGTDLHRASVRL